MNIAKRCEPRITGVLVCFVSLSLLTGMCGIMHADSSTTNSAAASGNLSKRLEIGPEFGVYIPTGSKAASRFGSEWWSVGLGLGQLTELTQKGALAPDISLIARYSSSNHVYMVPAGVQYRIALAPPSTSQPYVGVSADCLFADVLSPFDNVHSGLKTRGAASVFVGTKLTADSYIEARYVEAGAVDGIDLSGFRLGAGIRF